LPIILHPQADRIRLNLIVYLNRMPDGTAADHV
jgi:hypothetical protein